MKKKGFSAKVAIFLLAISPVLIEATGSAWWFGEPNLPIHYKKNKSV